MCFNLKQGLDWKACQSTVEQHAYSTSLLQAFSIFECLGRTRGSKSAKEGQGVIGRKREEKKEQKGKEKNYIHILLIPH